MQGFALRIVCCFIKIKTVHLFQFANVTFMAQLLGNVMMMVNVLAKTDTPEPNVMNANQKLPGKNVTNAKMATMVSHIVKVCLNYTFVELEAKGMIDRSVFSCFGL